MAKNIRKKTAVLRQRTAAVTVASMIMGLAVPSGLPAFAQEAAPMETSAVSYAEQYDPSLLRVDETMYVNLDYYGTAKAVNVVKGISTSRNIRYTDYGNYTDVLNMTSGEALQAEDGSVSMDVDGNGKKFFFQGTLAPDAVELPWAVSVSYKLNGVPVEAEKLAGASGLVEIDVKVTPNDAADEYLRNNMLLSVVIPADDSVYSVDAPGSQTQSVGDITGAAFTALPGEEKEFTARLGTDDYSSVGVIIMMLPATLDSFDNITEIRDLKDTWKDAGDAMYDSMDSLLSANASLRTEMQGLKEALNSADSAREKLSAARPGLYSASDEALASLVDLSGSVQKMIPYLGTAQSALSGINQDLNALVDTAGDMTTSLHTLYRGLNRLEDGMEGAQDSVRTLEGQLDKLDADREKLSAEIDRLYRKIEALLGSLGMTTGDGDLSAALEEGLAEYRDLAGMYDADTASASTAERFDVLEELSGQIGGGEAVIAKIRALLAQLQAKKQMLEKIATASNALVSDSREVLRGAAKTAQGAKYTADDVRRIILRTEDLNDTLNVFYPDLQSSLTDGQSLLLETGNTLNSSANALSLAKNALQNAADDTDTALAKSIDTSLSMIEKSLMIFDSLEGVQDAGGIAKDALDREVDKFETENRFLDMDPEAKKVSFTSERNKEPDSLQIILRTDEISADDEDDALLDAEQSTEDMGIFERIKNVFIRIAEAIVNIFSTT
ncbi:MAG: hypothetical protein Q4C63_07605 [Eubacteriales bacterium]|nr:hypothetical protein [Eubacteriales bacterium]